MERQRIWQVFDTLPTHAKQEVIDFIEFLHKRYKKPGKPKRAKITDEVFVGMWEDHDELKDSTHWVRELRGREWNN